MPLALLVSTPARILASEVGCKLLKTTSTWSLYGASCQVLVKSVVPVAMSSGMLGEGARACGSCCLCRDIACSVAAGRVEMEIHMHRIVQMSLENLLVLGGRSYQGHAGPFRYNPSGEQALRGVSSDGGAWGHLAPSSTQAPQSGGWGSSGPSDPAEQPHTPLSAGMHPRAFIGYEDVGSSGMAGRTSNSMTGSSGSQPRGAVGESAS